MRPVLLCLAVLVAAPVGRAQDAPFDSPGAPLTSEASRPEPAAPAAAAAPLTIRAYRAASRFQGPRCQHRPSCSAYAASAMDRFGPVLGSFVGVARLLRGSRSSALRPLPRDERGAFLDPLAGSTFFLGDLPR